MSAFEITAAPAPLPPRDLDHAAAGVASEIRGLVARGEFDGMSDGTVSDLMSALVALYAAKAEARQEAFALTQDSERSATEVLITVSGLLKGANIALFELGMWQSWSGMK